MHLLCANNLPSRSQNVVSSCRFFRSNHRFDPIGTGMMKMQAVRRGNGVLKSFAPVHNAYHVFHEIIMTRSYTILKTWQMAKSRDSRV